MHTTNTVYNCILFPAGVPCNIYGLWYSSILGFCFDIRLNKEYLANNATRFKSNIMLSIKIQECSPPKHHYMLDLEWTFSGNALNEIGGPLIMYFEKNVEHIMGTFIGKYVLFIIELFL